MIELRPYRIGWWTHRWWPRMAMLRCLWRGRDPQDRPARRVYYVRTIWEEFAKKFPGRVVVPGRFARRNWPHRPWQCEAEGCQFARRAFTKEGAARKMLRDLEHAEGLVTGHPIDSPWQLRRRAKANARAVRRAKVGAA